MKTKIAVTLLVIFALLLHGSINSRAEGEAPDAPSGTAITYQGRLSDGGQPANTTYDFLFTLYNLDVGGAQVGSLVTKDNVLVSDGYFTVQLDFGAGVFGSEARWLEVSVRPGSSTGNYTVLSPRQALTPATTALYAPNSGSAPWSGLTGIPAGFADNVDNDTIYTAGTGLTLSTGQFSVNTTVVQSRVSGTCSTGSSISAIAQNGTVTCETDDNTTYTAGTGLTLNGSQFNVNPAAVQSRVSGTCAAGSSIRVIAENGTVTCETDDTATSVWNLTGNAGTNPASNYLGTSDNVALELRVGGVRALRLEPSAASPNLLGGYSGNWVTSGIYGATISGGGLNGAVNRVTDRYGVVGGGGNNQAGNNNSDPGDATNATVSGGYGNTASGQDSFVGAGTANTASGWRAAIGGGENNVASNTNAYIGGGGGNAASGYRATISGGENGVASNYYATVGGGTGNQATYQAATVAGGWSNIASGNAATVPGGANNIAGGEYSFAAGAQAITNQKGVFVWADTSGFSFDPYSRWGPAGYANSFNVRATGGVNLATWLDSSGNVAWGCYFTNGNAWTCTSDKNMKENFTSVDKQGMLEKLSQVPVQTWNAKGTDPEVKHLGPTAQDFYTAFGLGNDNKSISTIDLDGVALVSIQGLYQLNQEQAAEIQALKAELREFKGGGSNTSPIWIAIGALLMIQAGMFFFLQRKTRGSS